MLYHKYALPQIFTIGGASWTLDPSVETVNCKIKLANKFLLVNILAYNNFIWTKKAVIIDVEMQIFKTYCSLFKSHLAVQICTVSCTVSIQYFVSS